MMTDLPEQVCQLLAEAGRGWPRLAEAGGRPELDLALGRRAGGRMYWPKPLGGCLQHSPEPSARVAALLVAAGAER